jgi:hypothetical protein
MKVIPGRKECGRKKCRQAGLLCWSDSCLCNLNRKLATELSVQQSLLGSSWSELRPISLLDHLWPGASWLSWQSLVRQCWVPCTFDKLTAAFVHGLCTLLVFGPRCLSWGQHVLVCLHVHTYLCFSRSSYLSLPFTTPVHYPSCRSGLHALSQLCLCLLPNTYQYFYM